MEEILIQIINHNKEEECWTVWRDGTITRHIRFIPRRCAEGELEVIATKRFDVNMKRLIQIMQEYSGLIGPLDIDYRGRWIPGRDRKKHASSTHFSRRE